MNNNPKLTAQLNGIQQELYKFIRQIVLEVSPDKIKDLHIKINLNPMYSSFHLFSEEKNTVISRHYMTKEFISLCCNLGSLQLEVNKLTRKMLMALEDYQPSDVDITSNTLFKSEGNLDKINHITLED